MQRIVQVLQNGQRLLRSDENRFVTGDRSCFNRYYRVAVYQLVENPDLLDAEHSASHL